MTWMKWLPWRFFHSLCGPTDRRLLDAVEFLLKHGFVNGAFYQNMIHSGLNAYLALHVAQALLRAGDSRYLALPGYERVCVSAEWNAWVLRRMVKEDAER